MMTLLLVCFHNFPSGPSTEENTLSYYDFPLRCYTFPCALHFDGMTADGGYYNFPWCTALVFEVRTLSSL